LITTEALIGPTEVLVAGVVFPGLVKTVAPPIAEQLHNQLQCGLLVGNFAFFSTKANFLLGFLAWQNLFYQACILLMVVYIPTLLVLFIQAIELG